jgi:hypothetical protein
MEIGRHTRSFKEKVIQQATQQLAMLNMVNEQQKTSHYNVGQFAENRTGREAKLNEKLNEIEPLLPSVRELQSAGFRCDLSSEVDEMMLRIITFIPRSRIPSRLCHCLLQFLYPHV